MVKRPGGQIGRNNCHRQNMEKRIKKKKEEEAKDSLRDLWDSVKCSNIHIIGASEGEKREKGPEKIFEEMRAENFPNMGKQIVNQVQEARVPGGIIPRRNTPRHIVIKMMKIKGKILKATR